MFQIVTQHRVVACAKLSNDLISTQ